MSGYIKAIFLVSHGLLEEIREKKISLKPIILEDSYDWLVIASKCAEKKIMEN